MSAALRWRAAAPALAAAAFCACAAALCARASSLSRGHLMPVDDEVTYLVRARELAPLSLPSLGRCFVDGRCAPGERHPLYAAALSRLVRDEPEDFARAKRLGWAFGVLMLGVVFALVAARRGASAAAVCAAVPALSWSVASLCDRVLPGVLFAALYFAAVALLPLARARRAGWLAFGALAGAASLTKGGGPCLLLAAPAVAAAVWGRKAARRLEPYLALAGFALVASPLLWGEARVFGWALRRPEAPAAAARLAYGAPAAVAGLALLLLASAGLACWLRSKEERADAAAILAPALGLLLFGWSRNAALLAPGFALPIALTVLSPAFWTLRRLWARAGAASAEPLWGAGALACGLAAFAASAGATGPLWALPPDWKATSDWLRAHRPIPDGVILDPASEFSTWDGGPDLRRPYPLAGATQDELLAQALRVGSDFFVLDRAVGLPPLALSAPADAVGPLFFASWPRCFASPGSPSRFLIYGKTCPRDDSGAAR